MTLYLHFTVRTSTTLLYRKTYGEKYISDTIIAFCYKVCSRHFLSRLIERVTYEMRAGTGAGLPVRQGVSNYVSGIPLNKIWRFRRTTNVIYFNKNMILE